MEVRVGERAGGPVGRWEGGWVSGVGRREMRGGMGEGEGGGGRGAVDDGAEEWAGNGGGEVAAQKEDQQRAV